MRIGRGEGKARGGREVSRAPRPSASHGLVELGACVPLSRPFAHPRAGVMQTTDHAAADARQPHPRRSRAPTHDSLTHNGRGSRSGSRAFADGRPHGS